MPGPTDNLDAIAGRLRASLTAKHLAREQAFTLSRDVIRNAANSIRAAHRRQIEEARTLLQQARDLLTRIESIIAPHPDLRYSGYVDDAQKELAEAAVVIALITHASVPEPEHLGVSGTAYLSGMGEAASEMRRYLLDALRRGEVAHCEEVLSWMDDIYSVLISMDFPDGLTGGLRRTTDQLRAVLERTRGDLTIAIVQERLGNKLTSMDERLRGG